MGRKRIEEKGEEKGGEKSSDAPTQPHFPLGYVTRSQFQLCVCVSICACMALFCLPTLSPFHPPAIRPSVIPFHKLGCLYPLPLECWLFPCCLGHLIGPVLCHSFCNFMGFPPVDQVPGSKYPRGKCFCIIFSAYFMSKMFLGYTT